MFSEEFIQGQNITRFFFAIELERDPHFVRDAGQPETVNDSGALQVGQNHGFPEAEGLGTEPVIVAAGSIVGADKCDRLGGRKGKVVQIGEVGEPPGITLRGRS